MVSTKYNQNITEETVICAMAKRARDGAYIPDIRNENKGPRVLADKGQPRNDLRQDCRYFFTCLLFWFSILAAISGYKEKSGAKYSK